MIRLNKLLPMLLFVLMAFVPASIAQHNCGNCPNQKAHAQKPDSTAQKSEPVYLEMPGQGKKVQMNENLYFKYSFDKKPKLGTVILKVEVFNKKGKRDTTLAVTGHSGMPSMKGAHDATSGFKLNKKGAYLMPVNIVMPGEWEIKLELRKGTEAPYRGYFRFKV